jgi:hypothetical protein
MKKQGKGALIQSQFLTCYEQEPCYTCRFHDAQSTTLASVVRYREYERATHKTYFCSQHGEKALAVEKTMHS